MEREEQTDQDAGITGVTAAWRDRVSKNTVKRWSAYVTA